MSSKTRHLIFKRSPTSENVKNGLTNTEVRETPPSNETDIQQRLDETTPSNNGTVLPTKFKQRRWTIVLFAVTLPLSALFFLYIYAALIAKHPRLGRLLFSPSRTIFVVVLLSQIIALLIKHLYSNVFDVLRWQLASRDSGVHA